MPYVNMLLGFRFAIRGVAQLRTERQWDRLAHHISKDLTELPEYLPDKQLQHPTEWSAIIKYYRDSYIRFSKEKRAWEGILVEEQLTYDDSKMPIDEPIDWTTLPAGVRIAPFNSGDYRSLGSEASNLRERRIENRSDPNQDGKRKGDEASVDFLKGKPLTKISRLDDTDAELSKSEESREEYFT